MGPRDRRNTSIEAVTALFADVLGPVVVIVALGAALSSRYDIGPEVLSRLAFRVLGPAFMFDILHDAKLDVGLVAGLVLAGLAGMVAAAAVAVTVLSMAEAGVSTRMAAAMTASYGNVGNAGLAISVFALGDSALVPAGVFMLTINVTGMMVGVALARGREGGILKGIGAALTAPMTLAAIAAIATNGSGWTPPLIMTRSIGLLAGALIPVMLFTLGGQLRSSAGINLSAATVVPTVAKLVVAPAVALVVAVAVGLETDLVAVATIQSAMPPAVFCVVVALEYDFEPDTVTSTVAGATLASMLTLPIVLSIVA